MLKAGGSLWMAYLSDGFIIAKIGIAQSAAPQYCRVPIQPQRPTAHEYEAQPPPTATPSAKVGLIQTKTKPINSASDGWDDDGEWAGGPIMGAPFMTVSSS